MYLSDYIKHFISLISLPLPLSLSSLVVLRIDASELFFYFMEQFPPSCLANTSPTVVDGAALVTRLNSAGCVRGREICLTLSLIMYWSVCLCRLLCLCQ